MSKRPLSPVGKSNPYFYCQKDYLETDITCLPKLSSYDEEIWKKILEESEREETKELRIFLQRYRIYLMFNPRDILTSRSIFKRDKNWRS